jgi:hypothetical protein
MGSGACARGLAHRGPGSPWTIASRPITRPRVNVPYTFPKPVAKPSVRDQKEVGPQGLKTPQWSAVRRGRSGRIGRVLFARAHPLCALRRSAPSFEGSNRNTTLNSRGPSRRENDEPWLFDNLDLDERAIHAPFSPRLILRSATQVGFTRLARFKELISGKPEISGASRRMQAAPASWFETRGVYHRAALRADPLALLTMRMKKRRRAHQKKMAGTSPAISHSIVF